MRAFAKSAAHPRFISRTALGLGVISAITTGSIAAPPEADATPGVQIRTVEVVATDGDPVVVINGERHVGGVRIDEASGTLILMDADGELQRLPSPAGLFRATTVKDDSDLARPTVVATTDAGPPRAMLGISMAEAEDGVRVAGVMPDTAAARVGLREGDVIVAIGGMRGDMGTVDTSTLARTVSARSPGEQVRLRVLREGRVIDLAPTLGAGDPAVSASRDDDREPGDAGSMESFAREMEFMIREMIRDRFGDGDRDGGMSMEFDIEFEEDHDGDHDFEHDGDRHDDHEGPWEEMFRHVEAMMEEARHETAGWMEEMSERSGHWAEETEHRFHDFAEMSDHRMQEFAEMTEARMNQFAEAFERELQRVMERQDEGQRETEMMLRERDLELREQGMNMQRSLGDAGQKLQETLKRFAEQHQRLAEENRRLNERVDRLEQAIRRMMSDGGPDRGRADEDRMRDDDSGDQGERSTARTRRGDDSERPDRKRRRGDDRD